MDPDRKKKGGQTDSNYQSYTDVSSIASYSSTRPSSVCDAKPITNPELCRHLRMTNSTSTRLKPHDQKILELMLAKREEQMMENQRRDAAHRKWALERERSASAGGVLRRDRRLVMSGDRKRDLNSTPTSRQRPTSIDHRHSRTDVSSKADIPRTKHLSGTSRGSSACSCGESCTDRTCRTPVRSHHNMMQKQLSEEKKQREAERKKRQEERLQQQKKNQDEYLRLLREEQQRELRRAESAKDVRAQEQQLKTKFRNFATKKRQEEAISKKLRQENEEKQQKKVAMAERLEQADKKRYALQRERQLHGNNSDLLDNLEKTKQKKEQLEMEMEVYRTELQTYLQMQEKRAEELAHESVLKKKMKAQEGYIEKTALQRKNLERLIEQEEEWKAEVEADIAMKETRMKILQMDKDDHIAHSRDLANTSRLLREQLRSHFSMNDLDQLNSRARLESRIHSPTYHMNNLTIKDK